MRILGALLLCGVAATHVLQARHEDAQYIVVLFIALALGCLLLAVLLAAGRDLWGPAALVCAVAIAGYVVSRTQGLPQMADDIGNWSEPLGIAALLCELGVIAAYFSRRPFKLSSVLSASRSETR